MLVCRKGSCHTINYNLGNFKHFNTLPNSEILLNLIRKMKYVTDQFQLCFFCIGNAKLIYFISALATQLASLRTTCWLLRIVCLVFALMSIRIQSWYFCVQDEEKLWFWMCLRQYQCCAIFACFLGCVLVFNSPVATPAHGLLGLRPSFRLRFLSWNASLLCMFVPPPTVPLH